MKGLSSTDSIVDESVDEPSAKRKLGDDDPVAAEPQIKKTRIDKESEKKSFPKSQKLVRNFENIKQEIELTEVTFLLESLAPEV